MARYALEQRLEGGVHLIVDEFMLMPSDTVVDVLREGDVVLCVWLPC